MGLNHMCNSRRSQHQLLSLSPRTKRRQQKQARVQKAALKQAHQQQQQQQQQQALHTDFHPVFFFLGYRGIVHPPSDDGGTERTWFVPEHRPRKHFLSDQSKASKMSTLPAGANKDTRQM